MYAKFYGLESLAFQLTPDARFFFDVDQQKTLADRVQDLEKVTFHVKIGSYLEKTNRVVELVKELGGDENARRAALLAKTKDAAGSGEFEPFKTSGKYDTTAKKPEYLN